MKLALDTRAYVVIVVALISPFALACEETVDPFIEADRHFTIYGYFDTAVDSQFLRVIPLRKTIGAASMAVIDATVTSWPLQAPLPTEWRHSIVTYDDGSAGHVFRGDFRPVPGWTYNVEVRRSDGAITRAVTRIPLATSSELFDPEVSSQLVSQRVRWNDITKEPFRVEVWYRFLNHSPNEPFLESVITYNDPGVARAEAWEIVVRQSRDKTLVLRQLGLSDDALLVLLGVGMRLTMSDSLWTPPGGVFDPEILVQPGTLSNVENGYGFVGSVNQFTVEWTLEPEVVELIGYAFPE